MKHIAGSPRLRLVVTLLLTIAIGVLSSVFATQITPNGNLDWSLATKISSFYWLLGVSVVWVIVHLLFLNHDENILRFSDDQHCIAHIRKTKLEGLAEIVKNDPEKAHLVDVKTVLKNLEVKTKSILLTKHFQDTAQNLGVRNQVSLREIVSVLERISAQGVVNNPKIHRVPDTSEEIYVVRHRNLRIFLTRKDGDLVLLSITNG